MIREQLLAALKGVTEETHLILTIRTPVRLLKRAKDGTPNPITHRVFKLSRILVVVNRNYEDAVNTTRLVTGAEPDFKVSPRQWGDAKGPWVYHDGEVYLNVIQLERFSTDYVDENNQPFDMDNAKQFLAASRPKPVDDTAPAVRSIKVSNIVMFTIAK